MKPVGRGKKGPATLSKTRLCASSEKVRRQKRAKQISSSLQSILLVGAREEATCEGIWGEKVSSGSRKRGVGKELGNLHDGFGGFDGWQ